MCAGTIYYDEDTDEAYDMEENKGLIPGHIYTLMSAMKVKIEGDHKRVVKLRNPCGDHGNCRIIDIFLHFVLIYKYILNIIRSYRIQIISLNF